MGCATARTVTLTGVSGHVIDVQADVSQGLVSTTHGRPPRRVGERGDGTGAAPRSSTAATSGPRRKRVTILLSPADLPKRGPHFDLAIALAVLAAQASVVNRRVAPRRAG